jgi:hypothetical protein
MTDRAPTVGEALAEFRRANGLPGDETSQQSWTCRLGPVIIRLPNFKWRRQAILAHDLHHVFTGYPCNIRGECQMAAWEFGGGPMPHWGAAAFCLPLTVLGLFWSPLQMLAAFRAGRGSRTLHGATALDALLAMPLPLARSLVCSPSVGTTHGDLRSDPRAHRGWH